MEIVTSEVWIFTLPSYRTTLYGPTVLDIHHLYGQYMYSW